VFVTIVSRFDMEAWEKFENFRDLVITSTKLKSIDLILNIPPFLVTTL